MIIVKSPKQWQVIQKEFSAKKTIGFVPTMGCLHEGHVQLIKQSKAQNALTVMSIFVNPAQFNDPNDYKNYPITQEKDLSLAESLGVDYVFVPTVASMYPDGIDVMQLKTTAPISQFLEGEHRPGHFDGVLIIVLKLLILIKPNKAYFGEKDYQQYQLIKLLVANFFLDCEVIGVPIIREASGLAKSSRNTLLSREGLALAEKMAALFQQYGTLSKEALLVELKGIGVDVEYLLEFDNRAYLAAKIEGVRLIDNIELPLKV